jgi:hypothetical protein
MYVRLSILHVPPSFLGILRVCPSEYLTCMSVLSILRVPPSEYLTSTSVLSILNVRPS